MECFATVSAGNGLAIGDIDMNPMLGIPVYKVDSKAATTRDEKDKLTIDKYIGEGVGCAAINEHVCVH